MSRQSCLAAAATLVLAALLAGCSSSPKGVRAVPISDPLQDFQGGVAADEPRAANAGYEILRRGGSAADAATAVYFALTVTYPIAASPHAAGMCVLYDARGKRSDAIDFSGGGAAPLAPRAFGMLQGRYGRLRWSETLVGAENMARFGIAATRAYARALAAAGPDVLAEPALADFVAGGIGRSLEEGQSYRLPRLADTLGRLRAVGVSDLYRGELAAAYLADAQDAGVTIRAEELAQAQPQWRPVRVIEAGQLSVLMPPGPAAEAVAKAWQGMGGEGGTLLGWRYSGFERRRIPALVLETMGAIEGAPAPAPAGTAFAVVDKTGQAVACSLGLGQPFGLHKAGERTGIVFATPGAAAQGAVALAANLRVNEWFAAAAAAGEGAPAFVFNGMAEHLLGKASAPEAVAAVRYLPAGPKRVLAEPGLDPKLRDALQQSGLAVEDAPPFGRMNLLACDGLPRGPESCRFAADRRGFGLALGDSFAEVNRLTAQPDNCDPRDASRACGNERDVMRGRR